MSDDYRVLRYPGDVTGTATPGRVLGADVVGRPYEVLDAEFHPVFNGGFCPEVHGHTLVHLQPASVEHVWQYLNGKAAS